MKPLPAACRGVSGFTICILLILATSGGVFGTDNKPFNIATTTFAIIEQLLYYGDASWTMANRPFNNEIAKRIVQGIGVAAVVGGGVVLLAAMPGLGFALNEIFDGYRDLRPKERYRVRKTFEALRRDRLVSVRQAAHGKAAITLTMQGKKKLLQYRFEDMQVAKPKTWDKRWRFVIFDIPKRYGRTRDLWRWKLKSLGFVQLQRSVWVFPYPCRDEIDFVAEYCGISPYARLLDVSAFDGSEAYEEMFGLR